MRRAGSPGSPPRGRSVAEGSRGIASRQLAEQSGLASGAVDVVTVATALHWFEFDRFYAEVKRLAERGILVHRPYHGVELTIAGEAQVPLHNGLMTRFVVFRDSLGDSSTAVIVGSPDLSRPVPVVVCMSTSGVVNISSEAAPGPVSEAKSRLDRPRAGDRASVVP